MTMLPAAIFNDVHKAAEISEDGLYRYRLTRKWTSNPVMVWIMLNPSTADADVDDPTIRRCISFAQREGCGGIEVINLYGLRATQPKHLLDAVDPEGPENIETWNRVLMNHRGPVVAAYGASVPRGIASSRAAWAWIHAPGWQCLGHTKDCYPRHPLYVKGDTPLVAL